MLFQTRFRATGIRSNIWYRKRANIIVTPITDQRTGAHEISGLGAAPTNEAMSPMNGKDMPIRIRRSRFQ